MRILIISDVHGNLPALEYVLKIEKSIDMLISLGDVVNYGPWSNECVDLLETVNNKVLILGNHEEAYISGNYPGTNVIAKAFFEVCYPIFNRREKIINYEKKFSLENCDFIHTIGNSYVFPDSDVIIKKDTFIGHSHRLFSKEIGDYRLINVGSVGQNRLNIDKLNYVIWNSETNLVELMEKSFSSHQLINEMKIRKYPEICLNYILSKRNKI